MIERVRVRVYRVLLIIIRKRIFMYYDIIMSYRVLQTVSYFVHYTRAHRPALEPPSRLSEYKSTDRLYH